MEIRKKLFDYRLFLNGLSQLRIPGFFIFVITLAGNFLYILNIRKDANFQITVDDVAPVLLLFMYIAPIVFVMVLFAFLNKRNGSDFYHSLPNTRTAVFTSFTAAVLTWVVLSVVIIVLLSSLFYYRVIGAFKMSFIGELLSTYIPGSILLTGAALTAVSLTGTILSNITVSYMILLLPRIVLSSFATVLTAMVPTIPLKSFEFLVNCNYDLPFNLFEHLYNSLFLYPVMELYSNYKGYGFLSYTGGPAFSVMSGLVLIALAGLLFMVRKSETAGKSAPNRAWQHVFRCALILPITILIPCDYIKNYYRDIISYISQKAFYCLVIIFISLAIYFLYEWITTKKAVNMLKAAPYLLAVIALNVIFGLSIIGARDYYLHQNIDPQDIASVSVNTSSFFKDSMYRDSYTDIKLREAQYREEDLIKKYADALKKTNENCLKWRKYWLYDVINQSVTYHLKNGKDVERCIYDNVKLSERIQTSEFISSFKTIPDDTEITKIDFKFPLNQKDKMRIFDQFREEVKSMKPEDFEKILCDGSGFYSDTQNENAVEPPNNLGGIKVSIQHKGETYLSNYLMTSLTPKTEQLYMELLYQENIDQFKETLKKMISREYKSYAFGISFYQKYNTPASNYSYTSSDYYFKNDKPIFQFLQSIQLKKPSYNKIFTDVYFYIYDNKKIMSGEFYTDIDEASRNKLIAMKGSN